MIIKISLKHWLWVIWSCFLLTNLAYDYTCKWANIYVFDINITIALLEVLSPTHPKCMDVFSRLLLRACVVVLFFGGGDFFIHAIQQYQLVLPWVVLKLNCLWRSNGRFLYFPVLFSSFLFSSWSFIKALPAPVLSRILPSHGKMDPYSETLESNVVFSLSPFSWLCL